MYADFVHGFNSVRTIALIKKGLRLYKKEAIILFYVRTIALIKKGLRHIFHRH